MDDVILAIRALLLAELGSTYEDYFYGENMVPAEADYPFVEVIPNNSLVTLRGTNSVNNEYGITIQIKDTLKAFETADTNKEIIAHMQEMVKRMEERDANGKPLSSTILGILQDNLQLSTTAHINNDWEIAYDTSPFAGSYVLIASLAFIVKRITLKN